MLRVSNISPGNEVWACGTAEEGSHVSSGPRAYWVVRQNYGGTSTNSTALCSIFDSQLPARNSISTRTGKGMATIDGKYDRISSINYLKGDKNINAV